jgi:hypothetical protein
MLLVQPARAVRTNEVRAYWITKVVINTIANTNASSFKGIVKEAQQDTNTQHVGLWIKSKSLRVCVSIHVVVGLLHFRRGDATDLLESVSSHTGVELWKLRSRPAQRKLNSFEMVEACSLCPLDVDLQINRTIDNSL